MPSDGSGLARFLRVLREAEGKLIDQKEYNRRTGDDMPEIKDWVWGQGAVARGATSTAGDNV